MPSSHLVLCRPLLLLPSIFPSLRVFSDESVLPIRWPKYGSFSFSLSPSSEYSGLISFRMDWLDLLAVQGTLKSLLQHHSSKASVLQRSAFFIVQLSQNLTFLKPWTNQCFFLMEMFVLSYVNEPCIYSRLCLLVGTAQDSEPVYFIHANVLFSYVNEAMFAWKPAFLQHSCQSFYGPNNSPCACVISKCML